MAEPIPVEKAQRACERMLAICAQSERVPWPRAQGVTPHHQFVIDRAQGRVRQHDIFISSARTTMRPLVEYVRGVIDVNFMDGDQVRPDWPCYAPLAAIIQHLDSTEPGWEGR